MTTWTLVMVLTTGNLSVIGGFPTFVQCETAGNLIRTEYEWRLPRVCVEVGPSKPSTPRDWDFEEDARKAAEATDAKFCAKAKDDIGRRVFCKTPTAPTEGKL